MADDLIQYIRDGVIGKDDIVDGPFGPRPVVYADYTASGRSLSFIEDYIRRAVLPLYANTHTESSGTGRQTTRFRDDARECVARGVGATDEHVVIFTGSGSTHAIAKLVGALGIAVPSEFEDRYHLTADLPEDVRPVVFIGPYEHHSNELPWRESLADVVTIGEDIDGHVDLAQLEAELKAHEDRPLKIGSFSAASNVTGIVTDTAAVSALLHEYGALACWDFAAAAPYVEMDMGSKADGPGYFDAVFISPHKFIGGPGTPGVLVSRRELFVNRVPVTPGGGTVSYVNPAEHRYLPDIEHREEGGTPAIVESIRAGLVFQLKEAVGTDEIKRREEDFVSRAIARWSQNPNLQILGSKDAERLSILSFVVQHGEEGRFLHHNAVVALLNDLFGVQSRGGCSCAGPYGHRLLGIDLERSHEFEAEIGRGCEGIKPGWIRVNFNYFIDENTFEYIVNAVDWVATHGAKVLALYRFDPANGLWCHRDGGGDAPMSLHEIAYDHGSMQYPDRRQQLQPDRLLDLADQLIAEADAMVEALAVSVADGDSGALERPVTTVDFEHLRWFPYPDEVNLPAV